MSRMPSKRTLAVAAASVAVVTGGGAALAASSGSSPTPSSFFEAVARNLGISTERLEEATKAAALEQVGAALEAGTITEEQAEELRSRIESGDTLFFGGFGLPRTHVDVGGKLSAAADYLELSAEELHERLDGGQSLAEIAEAEGKSVDGLKQAILDDARSRLDEAVNEGRLTAEQAEAMLDRLESRIDDLVEANFEGPRFERPFGPGLQGVGPPDAPAWGLPA
jgi:hypothetical protein